MPRPRFPEERHYVKCRTCRGTGLMLQNHYRYDSHGNRLGVRPCCEFVEEPDGRAHDPYCPDRCVTCHGVGLVTLRHVDIDAAEAVIRTVCGEGA